jgi:hypothetical protein
MNLKPVLQTGFQRGTTPQPGYRVKMERKRENSILLLFFYVAGCKSIRF